ncbi:hypothetical protein FQN54_002939 [Arachnomyces sp. PD_36]|nr:hypothetical protein FQN54_002939 [Arachnomyces sp. PD_36]
MSMIDTVPFEDGINVQSMIRRLNNVKRERRRAEKYNAKMQPNMVDKVEPGKPDPELASTKPGNENHGPAATIPRRPVSPPYTDCDEEDPCDENGNIRPDATILGSNGKRRNLQELIDHIQGPNFNPVSCGSMLRRDSSVEREVDEESKRLGLPMRTRSDSQASDSSSSTGYIPPPEERTPGGTRKWNYRDIQAGRLPLPGRNKPMNGKLRIGCDSSGPFPMQGPNEHVRGRPQVNRNPLSIRPRFDRPMWRKRDEEYNGPENECCNHPECRARRMDSFERDQRIVPLDHQQPSPPEPKKEIEIKLKLELGVDPVLLGVSGKKEDGHPINVSAPLSRPSQSFVKRDDIDTTSPPSKTTAASLIKGLFGRGLKVGGLFLIVFLAIMIGYMSGSNVCH